MEKLMKFFPLLPEEKDTTKLILAIVFYALVPGLVATILSVVLALTIILAPLAAVVWLVAPIYTIMGIVFAILKFCGSKIG
jgi:hypothetical protein